MNEPINLPRTETLRLEPDSISNFESQKTSGGSSLRWPIFIIIVALAGFLSYLYRLPQPPVSVSDDSDTTTSTMANPFDELDLQAKSVYVLDALSGAVLYEKNPETQLPLASLTKLMTAIIASETLPAYGIIQVGIEDIRKEGNSGLVVNEPWRLKDLIDFTLLSSSNDGASALAASVAAFEYGLGGLERAPNIDVMEDKMNAKAEELGLTQTYFTNETGLDNDETLSGSYGSARDMGNLMLYILRKNRGLIEATSYAQLNITSLSDRTHKAKNTDDLVRYIPGIIGSKTGFTDLAGGNLAVIFDLDFSRPIIAVVLGSSEKGRFEDMEELIEATHQYFAIQGTKR